MISKIIDPGLRVSGVSIWEDGSPLWAGLIQSPIKPPVRGPEAWRGMARAIVDCFPLAIDLLVVELQQDDSRDADPDDLRQLTGMLGVLIGLHDGADVIGYKPAEWSMVPKAVRHERLRDQLTEEEWMAVESDNHNVLDAVALGVFEMRQRGLR